MRIAICLIFLFVACQSGEPRRGSPSSFSHAARTVEGWTVHVDRALLASNRDHPALKLLAAKLFEISLVVPPSRLADLRRIPIWIDAEHPLERLQYHSSDAWLVAHGYDPRMAGGVHIPRAQRFVADARLNEQPWVVMHELAHGYHDRVLGFDDERILASFERVQQSGIYRSVLHVHGGFEQHYALTDYREYFAESTEAHFGTNDFYPFVRSELAEFDRETYLMMRSIWGTR